MFSTLNRFLMLAGVMLLAGGCATLDGGAKPEAKPAVKAEAPAPSLAKVVWHVDFAEPRRMSAMIQNVSNMVSTYQGTFQDYDVRLVFLAGGIRFVTEDKLARTPFAEDKEFRKQRKDLLLRLNQLRELHNVKLEFCQLTIDAIGLPKEKIIPGVESVISGVVRIAELQAQGFSYLKVE